MNKLKKKSKKPCLFLLAFLLLPLAAYAEEYCAAVATTSGGTSVLPAARNLGHTITCQNLGPTNQVTCSIGGTPVSASHGFILAAAGGNMTFSVPPINPGTPGTQNVQLPSGAVKCISAASTSATCCSSW